MQNFLEDLILFVRKNSADPLMKVCRFQVLLFDVHHCLEQNFILQLKAHLLPHVQALHDANVLVDLPEPSVTADAMDTEGLSMLNQVVFQRDWIYQHHILWVNNTTYDVHHAQDTINPCTDHQDVMLLSPLESSYLFLYAHVLGIFHASIIYTGQGMKDYLPRCMEFLWVNWFDLVDVPAGWEHTTLDHLRFVLITQDDAYGFVDPTNVIRGCHLIPAFSSARIHPDGIPVSWNVRDEGDWKYYYVNR